MRYTIPSLVLLALLRARRLAAKQGGLLLPTAPMRRADGDTPVFHYGDNVFPRPVKVKPPPPQLQNMCPRWGGKGPVGLDRRAESDECVPDEIAYGQSALKQIGAPSVLVPR